MWVHKTQQTTTTDIALHASSDSILRTCESEFYTRIYSQTLTDNMESSIRIKWPAVRRCVVSPTGKTLKSKPVGPASKTIPVARAIIPFMLQSILCIRFYFFGTRDSNLNKQSVLNRPGSTYICFLRPHASPRTGYHNN